MDRDALLLTQKARQEGAWSRDMDIHPHFPHALNVRSRHAAVQNITENGDLQPREFPLVFLNRIEVKQAL